MRKSSYSPGGRANFGDETVVGCRTSSLAFSENMSFSLIPSEGYEPESEFIDEVPPLTPKLRGCIRFFLEPVESNPYRGNPPPRPRRRVFICLSLYR